MTTPAISTPDICDAYEGQVQVLQPILRNFGGRSEFFGQVVTIKCFEDNSLIKEQAARPGEGRVIVVDGGGSIRRALLGDIVAGRALENGWAGLIIWGCIRDVDAIGKLKLGVQALATIPEKTRKRGIGDLNVPVTFGGISFEPGSWVYADNNGVICSAVALELPQPG